MGQFKPMVKMETTEPSVILKLKKGGHVNMKKGGKAEAGHKKMAMGGNPSGSAMSSLMGTPALVGRPAVNAPVRAPGKPSMAMRRKAMMARPTTPSGLPMAPPPMKKGGKAMGGDAKEDMKMDKSQDKAMIKKAFKQHDMQEHKGGKGTSLKLKHGGKMATGGVTNGQGGYKKGGMATGGVKMGNAGGYKDGGMTMVEKDGKMVPDFAADGKGKMKMGGKACATGGVTMSNAGGYKAGGKTSKKAYATGGTVNSGRAVAMPQGNKKPSSPVSIDRLAGTFKRGGMAKMAEGGGSTSGKEMDMSKGAYDASKKHSMELEDAMNPLSMVKELYGKARDAFRPKGEGSVTKTEKSITVAPAGKKRGGMAC